MKNSDAIDTFLNSHDIAEYWKKINFQPNPLEMSYIIWQNIRQMSWIKETEWKDIIKDNPNYPIDFQLVSAKTLKELLEQYIALKHKVDSKFEKEGDGVYSCRPLYAGDHDYCDAAGIYDREEKAIASADGDWTEGEPYPIRLEVRKQFFNSKEEIIKIYDGDPDGSIYELEVYPIFYSGYSEEEVDTAVSFESMWFKFPTPFKRGDIVFVETNPSHNHSEVEPFVLLDNCTWGSAELIENGVEEKDGNYEHADRMIEIHSKRGDYTDMSTCGIYVDDDGFMYCNNEDFYLNLSYYTDKIHSNLCAKSRNRQSLDEKYKRLKIISAFIKGEISEKELLTACDIRTCYSKKKYKVEEKIDKLNTLKKYNYFFCE